MKVPITQSEEWQKLQEDLGEMSFFEHKDGYQYLAIIKHTPVGNYFYLPYGPVLENESVMPRMLDSIMKHAKQEHAIFVRIEPELKAAVNYLPKTAHKVKDVCPADTWQLDLTPEKSTLLTNFSQGTRTRYNTSTKKGIVIEKTKDPSEIHHLVALQAKLFKAKHLTAYDADYLKVELSQPFATLYLAKYNKASDTSRIAPAMPNYDDKTKENSTDTSITTAATIPPAYPSDGQILAASLFFDHAGTRYYMQSAADYNFRRLPATVALLAGAIFDAKDQGITTFDFWGIAPEGAPDDHPWKGFTTFKQSFGGYAVHYAGTYDIVLAPAKYYLYNHLRRLRK